MLACQPDAQDPVIGCADALRKLGERLADTALQLLVGESGARSATLCRGPSGVESPTMRRVSRQRRTIRRRIGRSISTLADRAA
jgi:hypothetical protein